MVERHTKLGVFLIAVLVIANPRHAYSAAGDTIANLATVSYIFNTAPGVQESTPGGFVLPGIGNGIPTTFIEDRLVNFSVASIDVAPVIVVTGQTNAVLSFSVTNNSNGPQDYLLAAINTSPNPFSVPVDNIDPASMSVFVESGVTPGYQAIEDTAVFIDELASTSSTTVYIVATIPASSVNDLAAVSLVVQVAAGGGAGEGLAINRDENGNTSPAGIFSNGATSVVAGIANNISDTTALEVVFNDPPGLNTEDINSATPTAQDIARNGQHSDTGAFVVQSALIVAVNKTITVIDTLGGTDPHVGATLRYQLIVTISGSVDDLIIVDPVPADTTYTSASIILNTVAQTDAVDGLDFSDFTANQINVDLSEAGTKTLTTADSPITIIFDVTID